MYRARYTFYNVLLNSITLMEYLTSHYTTFRKTHYRKIKLFEYIAKKVELLEYTAGFTIFPSFVALVQKNTYVECTKYVRWHAPPPANHKPQTREPWPKLAEFATTISHSFLGQISCLRCGNPSGASAPATHWTCFASAACGCSLLLRFVYCLGEAS